MSSGPNRPAHSQALIRPGFVSDDAYHINKRNIIAFQRALEAASQANEVGHQQYVAAHNELVARIQAGKRAECVCLLTNRQATKRSSREALARLANPQRCVFLPLRILWLTQIDSGLLSAAAAQTHFMQANETQQYMQADAARIEEVASTSQQAHSPRNVRAIYCLIPPPLIASQ